MLCPATKQSLFIPHVLSSPFNRACWLRSTSSYLTSPICTIPSLKTLQWVIIVFRTKLKLFKGVPQAIIFSYSLSPVVPWPSLYSSNMLTFFLPFGGFDLLLSLPGSEFSCFLQGWNCLITQVTDQMSHLQRGLF